MKQEKETKAVQNVSIAMQRGNAGSVVVIIPSSLIFNLFKHEFTFRRKVKDITEINL